MVILLSANSLTFSKTALGLDLSKFMKPSRERAKVVMLTPMLNT